MFADTSALYALASIQDRHHAPAMRVLEGIRHIGSLHLSNYVLDELLTRSSRRLGPSGAAEFVDSILASRLYVIHWIQEDVHWEAHDVFRSQNGRGPSFTDCTSFVLMRRLGLTTAFTFDRDFAVAGFEVVPRA